MREPFQWLEKELPIWVKKTLITKENADILLNMYKSERSENSKIPFIILAAFGSLLIGIGIISIFAYNWDELSRHVKGGAVILLLIISQCCAFWAKRYKPNSLAASEAVSIFWFLSFGCSLAVIGQVYNLDGNLNDLLRVLVLLSLPIMYLFNSRGVGILLFVPITFLMYTNIGELLAQMPKVPEIFFDTFLLFAWLLFYISHLKNNLRANSTIFLNLIFIIGVFLMLIPAIVPYYSHSFPILNITAFAAIFWILGVFLYGEKEKFYIRVFEILSKLAIFAILLVSCASKRLYNSYILSEEFFYPFIAVFIILFLLFCMYKRQRFDELMIPLSPLLLLAVFYFYMYDQAFLIFNIYILIGGLAMIVSAARKADIALANQGIILIAILIAIRFFDSDLSFLLKGCAFIVIGILFLILNVIMKKYIKDKR
ncbi:MAG: DUF2157 domain-containing protein [Campylobacteraceae bacterium]|jgi:uncharacterized membrane protein|nr:DUF2157 domain-containing protein [Campylobacteraceae bacterium]